MNDLKIFENEQFGSIRTVMINNEPWFVGKDVAEVLGYAKARNAIATHVDTEDKKDAPIQGDLGGTQTMTLINESGLYSLILSSKLPTAKEFKRWVTSEVLPSIRKTGTYTKPTAQNPEIAQTRAAAMMLNAKSRIATQMMKLWTAAGVEPQYQALAMNDYYEGLSVPRSAFKTEATAMYDLTTIAKHLGVMSKSGKPHAQAVGAIVEKINIEDGECEMTPYSSHGHDGVSAQYTLSVEHKIKAWLEENNYPNPIPGNGKNFTVKYKRED